MANSIFIFLALAYCCTLTLADKQNSSSIDFLFGPAFRVTRLRTPYYKNGDGIVQGARSCGGSGKILQWRFESCKPQQTPCRVPADGIFKGQVDFVPSRDISSLGLRLIAKTNTGEILKEFNYDAVVFKTVRKGEAYTVSNDGKATDGLKGKLVTLQYILYDKMSNEVEVCGEADIQYV